MTLVLPLSVLRNPKAESVTNRPKTGLDREQNWTICWFVLVSRYVFSFFVGDMVFNYSKMAN